MSAPFVSIVIPTLREAENLRPLTQSVRQAMKTAGLAYEIIFVDDDSQDGSLPIFQELQTTDPVRVHVRRRQTGLASAVVLGAQLARGEIIAVMDADLSHPAANLPALVLAVATGQCNLAIGSRFLPQSTIYGFPWPRKISSFFARSLVRPLTGVSDPLSGYFACKKELFFADGVATAPPAGYKILLELLAKNSSAKICEVAIDFSPRRHGQSKLKLKQKLEFLAQWARLMAAKRRDRSVIPPRATGDDAQ